MIRVLQVVTYMGRGGLESMLMNYYRHIDRQKVQFDFLVHRQERAAYDDEIEALGGKIYRLPRLVPWSRSYLSSLNHFFDTHPEYKIVHVHQDCLSSVILKAAAQHQVPIRIAHSHSANQDKNLKYLIKLWYRRSIPRYATQLFACGKAAGDWMFCEAPYQIVRNAIDISQYVYNPEKQVEMRKKLALPDGLIVGHVGRFNPPKNHAFLVDIFAALLKKEPSATLLLVGDGDGLPQIKSKVKSLGISDHVGLPLTMIEAQASGLPCIISDKVSEECIVTDGLVSTESLSASPSQWADRILSIRPTSRGNHRDEIAANGFDISNEAIKLQEYYIHANEQCH